MDQNNKNITHAAKAILSLWNIGLFALVWIRYYNLFAFRTHRLEGAVICIVIYLILYLWFCGVYKAFRIASTPLFDTIFAHFVSCALSDLLLYIVACLAGRTPLNFGYGAIILCLQIAGTSVITTTAKQQLMKVMVPKDTLIIYGNMNANEDVSSFVNRLMRKYEHLYNITELCEENNSIQEHIAAINRHDTVILFELEPNLRRELIKICAEQNKDFLFDPRVEDIICQGCSERHLLDTPLMRYDFPYIGFYARYGKRILDVVLSLLLIVILSPFMLFTAIAIKLEDHGPVFYKQKRVTKDGKIFDILKFRSMIVNAESMGVIPSTDCDPRITKIGKVIRATRFDEIPQFINILKGDMSFVGPRPERTEHVDLYSKDLPEFRYRLKVKGGLTGYAQVYGKYNTTPYDKLRFDLEYIENQSFLLDLKIFILTIRTVFQKEATEGFDEKKSNTINSKAKSGIE
jgi:exopolysaccharide biosynthesis polyprenyl glycosylphosphotransferase